MCTVTYIPAAGGVFITSNRDEQRSRATAAKPQQHLHNGITASYVTDEAAGGAWCGINQHGAMIVLLNGGREKHLPTPPYRQSRGIAVKQLLHEQDIVQAAAHYNTAGIAPFTLVLFNGLELYEMMWNGSEKELLRLPAWKNHIWSSATLYSSALRQHRRQQLQQWLWQQPTINRGSITHLHRQLTYENSLDEQQRIPGIETVSISVLEHRGATVHLQYNPFTGNTTASETSLTIQPAAIYETRP